MKISLCPSWAVDVEVMLKLRDIRNEPEVRRWMYTDHEIPVEEHLRWLGVLQAQNDTKRVFVVLRDGDPVGSINIVGIDSRHKRATWGFYLSETARGGLGTAIEFALIDYCFGPLGLEKLKYEALEGHDQVLRLHKRFLFREEGFLRSEISRGDTRLGAHLLGLTKAEWLEGREAVREANKEKLDRFQVEVIQ